jgi:hypothetical protein
LWAGHSPRFLHPHRLAGNLDQIVNNLTQKDPALHHPGHMATLAGEAYFRGSQGKNTTPLLPNHIGNRQLQQSA